MKYSPRPFERLLTRYIARQTKIIEQLINQFVSDATMQTTRVLPQKTERDFFFRDYPALSRRIDTLLRGLSSRLTKTIQAGCEWSWDLANAKNDNMLSKVLDSIGRERVPLKAIERWNQKNLPALEAFEKRRIGGMGLSDKVWAYTKGIKGDLELALDLGIGQGMSADRLSRVVREYLKEPNRLYRRVRDEKGVLRLSKSAANYHPGQGVYRSSYKNAVRLTATETNMAYRSADNERMNQMEWILGFEVHISDTNHTCLDSHGVPQPFYDICDELQGRYPKWFRFVGWHPNCRCYITTILPEKDEMIKYLAAMDENGHSTYQLKGEVTDVPPQMKEWLIDNQYRVIKAKSLPYWIKDNPAIANSQNVLQKIVSVRSEEGKYPELVSGLKRALAIRDRMALVTFDPISATVINELEKRHDLKDKIRLFENILSDSRAEVKYKNNNGARAVVFEGHKTKNNTWAQTLGMAEKLVNSGRSVAFLPELVATSSADALVMFKGRPVIADFKYLVTKKANTIALDLEQGFGQAGTLIIQLSKADLGQFRDGVDQLRRKIGAIKDGGIRFGNIILMNGYGDIIEITAKMLKQNIYTKKIKGFL